MTKKDKLINKIAKDMSMGIIASKMEKGYYGLILNDLADLFEKVLVKHIATSELRDFYRQEWNKICKS